MGYAGDAIDPNGTPEATANMAAPTAPVPGKTEAPEVSLAREALVKEWLKKVERGNQKWKATFARMRKCQKLARDGALKDWLDSESYVVPIIPRHINSMVSALYAKDPRAVATPRKKLMYKLWDGTPSALQSAVQGAQVGDALSVQIIQELDQVKAYDAMMLKLSKTLVLCWEYFAGEQKTAFKSQMKALVRRAKINGAAYVKLGFQRALAKNPEITAGIQDATDKLAAIEARLALAKEDKLPEDTAAVEALRLSMKDLQDKETIVVREGPVFDFPRSDEIIVDPKCRHLKTFAGAGWVAHKFDLTPEEVLEIYKVNVGTNYTKFFPLGEKDKSAQDGDAAMCRVYEIQNIKDEQCLVVCDGYKDFLKEPYVPDVKIERFWTLFPLVFNEVESDDEELFPPSDVWLMRHPQSEYNRAREALRQHRNANKPKYAHAAGAFEDADKEKLTTSPAHAVIAINGLSTGEKLEDKLQRIPFVNIDPNQYEVEPLFKDTLRAVGSQEADMGTTSKGTATESSIAEHGRSSGISDQTDELDDLLTELVRSTGQLMMMELSSDTVKEIAGDGAAWPDHPMTRGEVAKDLQMTIRAGSSGRPNAAAELANIERAVQYLLQIPGVNPEPLAQKYSDLLDIDMDKLYTAGVPSINAINAMAAKAAMGGPPGAGGSDDPSQQGGKGGQNAEKPEAGPPGPQPGYPPPAAQGGNTANPQPQMA